MRVVQLSLTILALWLPLRGWSANDMNVSFQSGVVNGSYLGADSGELGMAGSVDMGAELLNSSYDSYTARSAISLDPDTAIIRYLYAGVGKRFYLYSHTSLQPFQMENNKIEVIPKIQYFLSAEAGVGQIVVKQVTPSLSIQSTSVEYGLGLGVIYPFRSGVGLMSTVAFTKGIGISSVAVDSTIVKAMVGVTFKVR